MTHRIAARLDFWALLLRIRWRMHRHPAGPGAAPAMTDCLRRMYWRRHRSAGAEFTLPSGSPCICYAMMHPTHLRFRFHPVDMGPIDFHHTFPRVRAVRRDDPFAATPPSSEESQ